MQRSSVEEAELRSHCPTILVSTHVGYRSFKRAVVLGHRLNACAAGRFTRGSWARASGDGVCWPPSCRAPVSFAITRNALHALCHSDLDAGRRSLSVVADRFVGLDKITIRDGEPAAQVASISMRPTSVRGACALSDALCCNGFGAVARTVVSGRR